MLDSPFQIVYLTGIVIGSAIRAIYTRQYGRDAVARDRDTLPDRLAMILVFVGMFLLPFVYLFTSWLAFADYTVPGWIAWLGVPVFGFALWLLYRSHADLGHNWSPAAQIQKQQALVTGGVYRHIRHPMYAAHWVWAIAQILLLSNWIAGPAMLVAMLPLYRIRVPVEEQMMLEQFGDAYQEYAARTGRVLPRLGK